MKVKQSRLNFAGEGDTITKTQFTWKIVPGENVIYAARCDVPAVKYFY